MQDGNIHCHISNVSARAKAQRDRSAVAAAAYNTGTTIYSNRDAMEITHDHRLDVIFTDLVGPTDMPAWAAERAQLWNRVEAEAKRKDARLGKRIEVALTRDLSPAARIDLVRAYARHFVAYGCVVDMAIHADADDHNPHAHLLLTTRKLTNTGFGAKLSALDHIGFVRDSRRVWAELTNHSLTKSGSPVRVDHRSYKARGVGLVPTRHRGPTGQREVRADEPADRLMTDDRNREDSMTKPTESERREYPALTTRATWPPEPEAPPDLTEQQRAEHARYWQEQDALEIERLANDIEYENDLGFPEPHLTIGGDEFDVALRKARAEHGPVETSDRYIAPPEREPMTYTLPQRANEELYQRALRLDRTKHEQELITAARQASPEMRQIIKEHIIYQRMERLRKQDTLDRLQQLEKDMQQAERDHLRHLLTEEPEEAAMRPERGPDGLYPAHELEQARDEMVDEMERER